MYSKHGVVCISEKNSKLQKNVPYSLSTINEEDEFTKHISVFFPNSADTTDGLMVPITYLRKY